MGLRINTNMQSISAQRSLGELKQFQDKSLERLSSGTRIVRSGDDAAGMAISEKLKADIRGARQASRNASDGISMIQVAEGAIGEVGNILVRLRELSVQSASDTISSKERGFIDLEFQQLLLESERITNSTVFNGKTLINGDGGTFEFQIGTGGHEFNDRINYAAEKTDITNKMLEIEGMSVADKESAQGNLDVIDSAITKISGSRAGLGAIQNRLQSTVNNLLIKTESYSAANSRIRDADIAEETADLAKANILMAANTSVLAQANMAPSNTLKLITP